MNSKNVKSFNINKNAQINKINILQFVKIYILLNLVYIFI